MPTTFARLLVLACALLAAPVANAQLRFASMFQDHAVIQRDRPIRIWGSAPLEHGAITLSLGGHSVAAQNDKPSVWWADLPAMSAGGPYTLSVSADGLEGQTIGDVMIGDVWLCSGQSNMEMSVAQSADAQREIAAASDPQLRILTITRDASPAPRADFKTPVAWQPVTPQSIGDFSAACYFMARELRASQKVSFGLIDATWGGTAVNAWRSGESLAADPLTRDAMALLATYRSDRGKAARQFGATWMDWWRAKSHDEPWQANAPGDWKPVPSFDFWEQWGIPALAEYNGMLWYRTEITLTAAQAKQAATLTLGTVDDMDMSFVNGMPVGTTNMWDELRAYSLARGTLHAGVNRITIGALDTFGPGGMHGTPDQRAVKFADGSIVPLPDAAKWQYRITPGINSLPHAPWETIAGMGSIYNAMIAPMGPYPLRGVAWYQGESDADSPDGYAGRLTSMMSGWRTQFGDAKLPLLIVQLPNGRARNAVPTESGFATIRDEQRRAALADPHATLAVTIDLGDVVNSTRSTSRMSAAALPAPRPAWSMAAAAARPAQSE
jgi:sialate O-acetylesterase